jgi:two-component system sensor histidine kinase UhpB
VREGAQQGNAMWNQLSLRARINLLLACVLVLGLVVNIARLALEAGPRVNAEDDSVLRLARELVLGVVAGLDKTADADARLDRIVTDLSRLRHISIIRQDGRGAITNKAASADDNGAAGSPAWFGRLVHPNRTSVSIPVAVNGTPQSLVITSHPDDEMREIWDGIVTQLEVGIVIAVALFVVVSMVIGRALAPLEALSRAMTEIESGHYGARVAPGGAPELAAICTRLNHLAGVLETALEDRRRLAERMVSLQDRERKQIAHELHDEFGPTLFALRAHASALTRLFDGGPDAAALRHGAAILQQVDALQQFNRRILERLRPVGLAEFGLRDALGALLRMWQEAHPDMRIAMTISDALGDTGEIVDLTIYRVVQEALTNVFRHAQASATDILIEPVKRAPASDGVVVRVRDNGRGLGSGNRLGLGLTGMRERVSALGGTLTVVSDTAGVTVHAVIPQGTPGRPALADAAQHDVDREVFPVLSGK